MPGRRTAAIAALLLSTTLFAQPASPPPEFEAATIKLNKSGALDAEGGVMPGGQFSVRNILMSDLVQFAFDSRADYIIGAPAWFNSDRFDVVAKAPANTSTRTLQLMLQPLLLQEFKLSTHREQKMMDVYALVVAKGGPKLQKSAGSGDPDCKRAVSPEGAVAACTNMPMAELARRLQELAPAYVNREVIDMTGIDGVYDFKLNWVGRARIDQEGGLTLFGAVEKMLGLKLEERKHSMPVVVIDHVERMISE